MLLLASQNTTVSSAKNVDNSMESLQMFLEEEMEAKEETKGINHKIIWPTLMKNPQTKMVAEKDH